MFQDINEDGVSVCEMCKMRKESSGALLGILGMMLCSTCNKYINSMYKTLYEDEYLINYYN